MSGDSILRAVQNKRKVLMGDVNLPYKSNEKQSARDNVSRYQISMKRTKQSDESSAWDV